MWTQAHAPRIMPAFFLILLSTGAVHAGDRAPCQASDWDMGRELKAFGGTARTAAAGTGPSESPVLDVGTLYALRLHSQDDVHFVQVPARTERVSMPMGGMAHFAVASGGLYRITVDSPLWIDIVTPSGIISPSAYHGWHECSVFRKSVDYILRAGESVTLQFSAGGTDLVKMTVEPPTMP